MPPYLGEALHQGVVVAAVAFEQSLGLIHGDFPKTLAAMAFITLSLEDASRAEHALIAKRELSAKMPDEVRAAGHVQRAAVRRVELVGHVARSRVPSATMHSDRHWTSYRGGWPGGRVSPRPETALMAV